MHTATVEDLKNDSASLLTRVQAGEEIVITQRGQPVARIVPEPRLAKKVDWSNAPEVIRDRRGEQMMSAQEASEIIHEAAGKW